MKAVLTKLLAILATIISTYFVLLGNLPSFLSSFLFLAYLILLSNYSKLVLVKLFNLPSKSIRTKIFSLFLVFFSLGFIGGIFLLLTTLTAFNISLILLVNALLYFFFNLLIKKTKHTKIKKIITERTTIQNVPKARMGVLIYLILLISGFYLLFISKTGEILINPWQTIHPSYIYLFFTATLILGLLLFSKISTKGLLFLIILHSLLLHSYLPLTHSTLYGADQWRHLAVENRLLSEQPAEIVLHDKNPQNIIQKLNPGRLTYNNLWASEVILSRISGISLLNINKWVFPFIFAVLLPLLLFQLGRIFFNDTTKALLLTWTSFIIFPLQFLGSITLPVSYGLLGLLLFIILILKRAQNSKWQQLTVLTVFLLLSIFGYSLYFILFASLWFLVEIIKIFKHGSKISPLSLILIIPSALFFPIIELITKYSVVGESFKILNPARQFIGNITGYYLASGPRPHDILGGNIIFNQIPKLNFVSNYFLQWRWSLVIFMFALLILTTYGLFNLFKKQKLIYNWLCISFVSLWCGYFIGFYLLEGLRPFSRRLDMFLGILLLLVSMHGVNKIIFADREKVLKRSLIFIFIFSLGITASYSLGPDTKTVSADEFSAIEYIWYNSKSDHCVIAKTYPLLAMEYISAGQIVGGGFPIEHDFSQTQREDLLSRIDKNPDKQIWEDALKITNSKKCWFIDEGTKNTNNSFLLNDNIVNTRLFNDLIVWRYEKK